MLSIYVGKRTIDWHTHEPMPHFDPGSVEAVIASDDELDMLRRLMDGNIADGRVLSVEGDEAREIASALAKALNIHSKDMEEALVGTRFFVKFNSRNGTFSLHEEDSMFSGPLRLFSGSYAEVLAFLQGYHWAKQREGTNENSN